MGRGCGSRFRRLLVAHVAVAMMAIESLFDAQATSRPATDHRIRDSHLHKKQPDGVRRSRGRLLSDRGITVQKDAALGRQ